MFQKLLATLVTIALSASHTFGAQWTSTYISHNDQMLNQERGTYVMREYKASAWSSISPWSIEQFKQRHYNTLILALINLDSFRASNTINQQTINNINNEMQIYRSSGVKCIVRFIYVSSMRPSAPWGDAASVSIVLNHIAQMTPMLTANQDVIAYAQTGFIGIWGEWYYTDAFGDAGRVNAQNIADRKKVHEGLLAALPQRTVQVRTPGFMQQFYGNSPATTIGTSSLQRSGTHNDCFLADASDQGTYTSFGTQYPYLQAQTKYTGAIFETCAVSYRSTCPTALTEIAGLHMVSGHRDYNTNVWNQWIAGGCYEQILKMMGHRLSLTSSTVDLSTAVGSSFTVSVGIRNTGVSAPINARKTEIVLRKVDGDSVCVATLNVDAKTFDAGATTTLRSVIRLPSNIPAGRWELLLQFADPYSTLYGVPWYKIQAANNAIYESGTGMHKLNAIIDVVGGASVNGVVGGEVQAQCGLMLRNVVNTTVTSADGSCLGGYYKVGTTCTMCPAGSACASQTSSPSTCPQGTYSAGGQRTCTPCPSSCSGKGTCQRTTGACLCNNGASGFDCSIASSTPITLPPVPTSSTGVIQTTGCSNAVNLLVNRELRATGTVLTGWTSGGTGYLPAAGLQGQPSVQLYIPVGTTNNDKWISQLITFPSATSIPVISFGAYTSSYQVSGVADNNFGIAVTVTYVDGTTTTAYTKSVVPSSVWVWSSASITPTQMVKSILYTFQMKSHTGNGYMTSPVLVLAPACAVASPTGVTGGKVLAGEDDSQLGLSQATWYGIYAAAGAVVLLVLAGVGVFCWRKKAATNAADNAVATQMSSV